MNSISDALRKRRKQLNMTQMQAANACGISVWYYASLERGTRRFENASQSILDSISEILKIDLTGLGSILPQEKTYNTKPYKEEAIAAARELFYGEDVVNAIKKAETDSEINYILASAREKSCRV